MIVALMALSAFGADHKVITPANGVPPVGPYSPGVLVGDYLYVSGQGSAKADGTFPATTEEQTAQTLTNVRRIVEAAGMTMEHIVYATVYLKNIAGLDDMNRAWRAAFPKNPPARVVLGVEKMPVDTPVEITVVAYRNLAAKKTIQPGPLESRAVATADRVYVSACKTAEEVTALAKTAAPDVKQLGFTTQYWTSKATDSPNTKIRVAALPGGAAAVFTGVATRKGDTLFYSAQVGGANIEEQVRATMRELHEALQRAGMTFASVVATNVYLDDIGEFAQMNKVYAESFGATPPTRTTIQPSGSKEGLRISLIAVK